MTSAQTRNSVIHYLEAEARLFYAMPEDRGHAAMLRRRNGLRAKLSRQGRNAARLITSLITKRI